MLEAATAKGLRTGENPARWRGRLDQLLPKPQRLSCGHHTFAICGRARLHGRSTRAQTRCHTNTAKPSDPVFTGAKGKRLSSMAMAMLLRRMGPAMTAHGFRSAFDCE